MIDFVLGLVEEHVDLGGSQFSESFLERWHFARASQWSVVVLEFGSPCPPRSPSLTHDSRHDQRLCESRHHPVRVPSRSFCGHVLEQQELVTRWTLFGVHHDFLTKCESSRCLGQPSWCSCCRLNCSRDRIASDPKQC